MKAPAFDYVRASSVAQALELLAQHSEAKIIAGGQSLVPALNLRLLAPEILIDIGGIEELRYVRVDGNTVRIGALTRHVDLMGSPEIAEHVPLLAKAMPHVAHAAIRTRGTIGGNLAHADPASELPACMMALDATFVIQGPEGERRVAAGEFFTGIYATALSPEELLVGVEVPIAQAGSRAFFQEFARRSGDYAIIGLAASAVMDGGEFSKLRLGYFSVGDKPTLAAGAAQRLVGRPIGVDAIAEAKAALEQDLDPQSDQQASSAARLHLAGVLLERCANDLPSAPDFARSTSR